MGDPGAFSLSANDESAILTNDDAASCKIWASKTGYWKDDYSRRLVPRGHDNPPRRMPEISRGYWGRVEAIARVVASFIRLHSSSNCQVVILGCGYDSLYWRLRDYYSLNASLWVETDLPPVIFKKAKTIQQNAKTNPPFFAPDKPLLCLQGPGSDKTPSAKQVFGSGNYRLASGDLNQNEKLVEMLTQPVDQGGADLRTDLPTLFVTECVLVYLEPNKCADLLAGLAKRFPHSSMLIYEQCNVSPHDTVHSFGKVMLDQLSAKGIQLLGVNACASINSQLARLKTAGFSGHTAAVDMYSIYSKNLAGNGHRDRIERLEMLDEGHLLQQLLSHYCVALGQQSLPDKNLFLDLNKALSETL